MKCGLKKNISAFLIVVMVASSTMLLKPKPADAFIDCILQAAGLLGGINSAVSSVMAVPVHDIAVGINTSSTAADSKSLSLKECLLDRIAYTLINTMIQNFTASTVDWINSGFEGSPSFVTDPEGFFTDVGDQVAGKWITSLGPIGSVLCSPFDLQIRLSLSIGRSSSYRRYVGCRLSDVQKNIYGAFVKGDWGANGWSNWVSISQTNNNVYGAYITADDKLTQEVLRKIGVKKDELSWNKGFLSWRKCIKKNASTGACEEYEKNANTPGSVIESQLNNTLGSGQRRIEMADEINEIMDALMNQAIGKIFSSTGLLGMSQNSPQYNGSTYLQSLSSSYETELGNTSIKKPSWAMCDRNYKVYVCSNNIDYPCNTQTTCSDGVTQYPLCTNENYQKVVTVFNANKITDARTGECRSTIGNEFATGCYEPITIAQSDIVSFNNYVKANTALQIETQITRGCANSIVDAQANQLISDNIGSGQNSSNNGTGTNTGGTTQKITKIENVALNKPVINTEDLEPRYSKYYGNDGTPSYYEDKGVFVSRSKNGAGRTWTVDLQGNYEIKYLVFYPRSDGSSVETLGDIKIFLNTPNGPTIFDLSKNKGSQLDQFSPNPTYIMFDPSNKVLILRTLDNRPVNTIKNVQSITIQRTDSATDYLAFSEFQAFAIINEDGSSPTTTTPTETPKSSVRMTTVDISNIKIPNNGGYVNFWLNLNSAEFIPEMNLNFILNKITGTNTTKESLFAIFSKIEISRALTCGDSSVELINDTIQSDVVIPKPVVDTKQYCLNIKAATQPNTLGSFELNTSFVDDVSLSAGKHKTSFEVYSVTAP